MTQSIDRTLNGAIQKAAKALHEADAVLITAGAGMGVDSGLPDFRGKDGFWKAYPVIAQLGISFEEMANPEWFEKNPRLAWAFYGHRLNLYRQIQPHVGFARLLDIGNRKPHGYFVLTSNVDGQFQKAVFDEDRIDECHGSIHHLQCTRPCSEDIWSANHVEISIDEQNFRAISPLPKCPKCGALARPNILMFFDGAWEAGRTNHQENQLWNWREGLLMDQRRLVIVEIGAGQAVSTIRQRSEYYADQHFASLIRINPRDYNVSKERHISLPLGGMDGIEAICKVLNEDLNP